MSRRASCCKLDERLVQRLPARLLEVVTPPRRRVPGESPVYAPPVGLELAQGGLPVAAALVAQRHDRLEGGLEELEVQGGRAGRRVAVAPRWWVVRSSPPPPARPRGAPCYSPYFSMISFLPRPRMPYFAPTFLKAAIAVSRWCLLVGGRELGADARLALGAPPGRRSRRRRCPRRTGRAPRPGPAWRCRASPARSGSRRP